MSALPQKISRGDIITADFLNSLVDEAAMSRAKVKGAGRGEPVQVIFGRLTEYVSADEGYKWVEVNRDDENGDWIDAEDGIGYEAGYGLAFPMSKCPEIAIDTSEDADPVVVPMLAVIATSGLERYVFPVPGGSDVIVKITGNASGGGQYNGRILAGGSTADGSGNLAMPEGLTVPDEDDALVLHTAEDGYPTHWLEANSFSFGKRVGSTDEGKAIVVVSSGRARTATPTVIGSSSEGADDADTYEWQRAVTSSGSIFGDSPVDFYAVGRVVYNHAGDEKLYAMVRKLSFAADGRLHAIGPETRVEVETPEDC